MAPEVSEKNQSNIVGKFVDPMEDADWDQQVLTHSKATVFHSAAWARVLSSTYGHRPKYFRFTRNGGLVALVPLMEIRNLLRMPRGVALPFSDFCDSLVFEQACSNELFSILRDFAERRSWSYMELRGEGCVPASATPSVSFYSHRLDLRGGYESICKRFKPSVRRALRKVERSELTCSVSDSEEAMRIFFKLHVITRRRHGLPPQSIAFFLNIHREIIASGMGSIVIVRVGRRPIAAMVFFHWGNVAIYKFGASDKRYQRYRPNNFAMSEGIKLLSETGLETLHFGRSSLANEGLRRFKLTWGGVEGKLDYYRYYPDGQNWGVGRDRTEGFHTEVFRRLPPVMNRIAGRIIYSHLD